MCHMVQSVPSKAMTQPLRYKGRSCPVVSLKYDSRVSLNFDGSHLVFQFRQKNVLGWTYKKKLFNIPSAFGLGFFPGHIFCLVLVLSAFFNAILWSPSLNTELFNKCSRRIRYSFGRSKEIGCSLTLNYSFSFSGPSPQPPSRY